MLQSRSDLRSRKSAAAALGLSADSEHQPLLVEFIEQSQSGALGGAGGGGSAGSGGRTAGRPSATLEVRAVHSMVSVCQCQPAWSVVADSTSPLTHTCTLHCIPTGWWFILLGATAVDAAAAVQRGR